MIIENIFVPLQPFVISLKGLEPGRSEFKWHADREFFASFENTEILDADLEVVAEVDYEDRAVDIQCRIDGTVVVICDRCLEELTLPVHTSFEESEELDLRQDVYDYVCISLPMQRIHPEGECNGETVKYLSK